VITQANVQYMWTQVINPRVGDPYVWGGVLDPSDPTKGTDCSGAVGYAVLALLYGPQMQWANRPFWTGSFAGLTPGQTGPLGLVCIASPQDAPADAAMVVAIDQGPTADSSHMVCNVMGTGIESNGNRGLVTGGNATPVTSPMFNQWFYLPGPVSASGGDTLFADVSEFQMSVDDSYPYEVLSIRVCDGTYQDHHFAQNYAWMRKALDDGRLTMGIVYSYVRTNADQTAATVKSMIDANGGLHPKVVLMLDVESGGNPAGDGSSWVDALYTDLVAYAGDPRRVIGYGNKGDLNSIWLTKPSGIRLIVAGYGSDPHYPGEIAHQYTDGGGYGGGLPEGCSPFGNCDMNSADGLSPQDFAAACGITTGTGGFLVALTDAQQQELYDKVTGMWASRSAFRHVGEGVIDDTVGIELNEDGNVHVIETIVLAWVGWPGSLALLSEVANADLVKFPERKNDAALAKLVLKKLGDPVAAPVAAPVVAAPVVDPAPAAPAASINWFNVIADVVKFLSQKGK